MCLAIPGRIVEIEEREFSRAGKVEFGGVTREVFLDFVPEAQTGDYVLVHAGFAITRIDEAEATKTLALLAAMEASEDLETHAPGTS